MAENVVYIRATRAAVRQAIAKIPAAAMGDHGAKAAADALMTRCGLVAKSRIYRAFITKSRGGTDEAGERWEPLAPSTIARRRHGKVRSNSVDILRDTGLLLNTFSPGIESALSVFRIGRGEVIVGTNRKWAGVHHEGSKDGRIPQRRLWPEPRNWPASWWIDITEQARAGLVDIAEFLIKRSQ